MVNPNDDELFDIADFNSVEIAITLTNLTSSTALVMRSRVYGDEAKRSSNELNLEIHFSEFLTNGFILDVPKQTGAEGHRLKISIEVLGAEMPFIFESVGVIKKIQSLNESRDAFTIELVDFDPRFFAAFQSIFSARQKQIEDFFNQVKG
jgi:hypothetical protein